MQEDVVILLEWLNANGISELFNDEICNNSSNENDNKIKKNTTTSMIEALAEQQKEIKSYNQILGKTSEIKNIIDQINTITKIIEFVNNSEFYNNFRTTASNTIVFNGNQNSDIMIINDLPNDLDDIDGNIFSGDSGILLNNMMKSINIEKSNYCLLNCFFWRLPGNRSPIKEELEICKPLVEKIISIIKPKLIIFTGNYSISTIFENNKTLVSTRGKFFDYTNCYLQNNIKITATYSPIFLMKNKIKKRDAWQDLLKIKDFLNNC